MGERRELVIGSQCESLNPLSFLPDAARELADTLLDPAVGDCVPAVPEHPVLVDPTVVELDDAVTEAFRRASQDEATLFLAIVGHGEYVGDDFYVMARDTGYPPSSRQAFLLAQRVKELLGRHSLVDGLVLLLDTCHAGIAAQQAAGQWVSLIGQAGRRFEVLTASDDRSAADGCFTRTLSATLRAGSAVFGQWVRCADLKPALADSCRAQTAQHLSFDGSRFANAVDEGLWLARNPASVWRGSPWAGTPLADEIDRLTARWPRRPDELAAVLGEVAGHVLGGARFVALTGLHTGEALAALAHPTVAQEHVPARFLHAIVLETGRPTTGELARDIGTQLARSVPGFADAAATYQGEADDELTYHVLGPLRLLASQSRHRVRIALDLTAREFPRRLYDAVLGLGDRAPDNLQLIIAAGPYDQLPVGARTVVTFLPTGPSPAAPPGGSSAGRRVEDHLEQPASPPTRQRPQRAQGRPPDGFSELRDDDIDLPIAFGDDDPPDTEPVHRFFSDADSELGADFPSAIRASRPRPSHGRPPIYGLDLSHEELTSAEAVRTLSLLGAAPADVPVPLSVLAAASGRLDGPAHPSRMRDVLTRLRGAVHRTDPATERERVLLAHRNPLQYGGYTPMADAWLTHAALADAIAEVAPMTEHDPDRPEHAYAQRAEPVHLWATGRHDEALRSLEARESPVPVENRERWSQWRALAEAELGPDHPVTLRAAARHATWLAKAGDPPVALVDFERLLPKVFALLGPEHADTLSLRHNIAYWHAATDDPARAVVEFHDLAETYRRLRGPDDQDAMDCVLQAAIATAKAGDVPGALAGFTALLPDAERALGTEHRVTISTLANLVYWGAGSAHPPPAVESHIRRLAAIGRVNEDNADGIAWRFVVALGLAKIGRVGEALARFGTLLPIAERVLGDHAGQTEGIREQLAYWG